VGRSADDPMIAWQRSMAGVSWVFSFLGNSKKILPDDCHGRVRAPFDFYLISAFDFRVTTLAAAAVAPAASRSTFCAMIQRR
jgi:hypothetical protein